MANIFLFITCVILTSFIGWNILYLLSGKRGFEYLLPLEKIGLACLFGFGIITVQMFVMSLFRVGYTRFNILIPWFFVVIIVLLKAKGKNKQHLRNLPNKTKCTVSEITLFSLIALQVVYNFFRALIKPIESYDAVSIYGLKSKIIYLSHGIGSGFFENLTSNFHGAHPDYPLLVPLKAAWIYTFMGNFNDILVKAVFPLFYVSFLFVFFAVLKRLTKSRFVSLLFTFILASVKQFADYSTIGYADLQLGIYFAIGLFYLYLWMKDKEKTGFLNISLVATGLCLWTKNEGILLALITLSVIMLYVLTNLKKTSKKEVLHLFGYILIIAAFILSWNMFKESRGLVNENFNPGMITIGNFTQNLNKIPLIIYEYQKHLFGFKKWNIVWILFVFLLIRELKTAFSDDIKYITLGFILFGFGYSLMYIFSVVEIKFFLSLTGSRFLLHILPVAVFWMAVVSYKQRLIPVS